MTARALMMAVRSGPSGFVIPAITNAAPSTVQTSAPVTPTGYGAATSITVSGFSATVSVQGGSYASSGTIAPGQHFTVRMTAAASYAMAQTATVNVGGTTAGFTVTTQAAPAWSFSPPASVTGVALNTLITSAACFPSVVGSTTVSVTNAFFAQPHDQQVSVNGGAWGSSASIGPGDYFQVRITSNSAHNSLSSVAITIDGVTQIWNTTTIP